MPARIVDMTGKRFANVIAVRPAGQNKSRGLTWDFVCDCGAEFQATGSEVRYGRIKSCPSCAAKKKRAATTSHGLSSSPSYRIWSAMKTRCSNPNFVAYAEYGGRGISVCQRWDESFLNFLEDMGERPTPIHTVERNDTNGDYEPSNCRWATPAEQANNKRNNRRIEIEGEIRTLAQWANHVGINESSMRARLAKGITGAQLLTPPSTQHKRRKAKGELL